MAFVVIAGGDEKGSRPRLRGRAAALGLAERVGFIGAGRQPAEEELLQGALALLITLACRRISATRRWRPWPRAPRDRGSAGRHLRGGIEHPGGGFVVAPDPEAFAGAVRQLQADPDLRSRMGRRGEPRWPKNIRGRRSGSAWRPKIGLSSMASLGAPEATRMSLLDKITPLILTRDEEVNIGRVLSRLSWARDIVVVDSGSTDGTGRVLARSANVRCFEHKFESHAAQWLRSHPDWHHGWVLALDADMC
jgi:hypothetical protein